MKDIVGVFAIFAVLTVCRTASALQCWKCSSDIDRTCHDRFNESDILARRGGSFYNNPQQNYNQRQYDPNVNQQFNNYANNYNGGQTPILETCDDNESRLRRMKNVCIKKTVRGTGYVSIIRRCAMIPPEQDVGTCQEPVSRGLSLDFCEYCEYDGCNSARGFKTNYLLASAAALFLVLFLSH